MSLRPTDMWLPYRETLITESKKREAVLECASLFLHAHSSNTDVIAGSSSISLRGNLVIIPTPGHNGLLKQHWTE